MARIRSIKPEFWTSAQVLECSTNARLMFIGIWNFADDAGRHPWSAKQVKAEVFPAEEIDLKLITKWLEELETNGLIKRYYADNKEYFYVTGWKHQRIDKPQSAKYPAPIDDNSTTIPRTIPPDRIGEDKIGKDKIVEVASMKRPSKRGERLSEDWSPSSEGTSFATEKIGAEGATQELEKFRDYWISMPGQRGVKLDWDRTWRNWIRNSNAGNYNGSRGSRPLQDDSKSVSKAIDRLANAAESGTLRFAPRPSLLPVESESDLRLLPKG